MNFLPFRLKTKIRTPHEHLENNLNRLRRLQVASDALRRVSRFVTLSRRLEIQMAELDRIKAVASSNASSKSPPHLSITPTRPETFVTLEPEGDLERVVSQAALYIAEICKILKVSAHKNQILRSSIPSATLTSEDSHSVPPAEDELDDPHTPEPITLKSIDLVERHTPVLQAARTRINAEMENMVLTGLDSLVSMNFAYSTERRPSTILSPLTESVNACFCTPDCL